MSAINESALPKNVGILSVADYSSTSITQLLTDISNAAVVKGQLDGLSYERIASITDLEVVESPSKNKVQVDTDDNGTIYKSTTDEISVKGNWFELFETNVIEKILGQTPLSQAGTLVSGATQTWAANTVTKFVLNAITGQNANKTKPTITHIKQGATTLVEGTDYEVVKRQDGIRCVVFLTPFVVANATTLTYDYTPAASKFQGRVITNREIAPLVVKIASVDSKTGKNRITYLVNCGLESDLVSSFIDVSRAKDMKSTPFEFMGNKQGFILKYFEV